VPGAPDYFWVNPFGLFFDEVTADNLVLVSKDGDILSDWPQINFAGFCIHSAIHQARADVTCAVHTHPPAGAAFSALKAPLVPIEQMGCSFYEDLAVYADYTGIVVTPDQAGDIVAALGNKRALILANHGLMTVATTVEQALIDMLDLERTCAMALRVLATGQPLQEIGGDAASVSKAILTQPERYPFQWDAMLRRLDRAGVKYDPAK
jgi:ribulose-5-phosphate 4-epimerase/fuculose-1-phosphate aldolase